jgi:hypothetical protein
MKPDTLPRGSLVRWRYRARYVVSLYPWIYMPFARRHYVGTGIVVVEQDTDLVIEGFGRSGSTFAVDAFKMVQKRAINIAHHTHAAAQVIVAVKTGIPTLLIVRDPVQTTLAHMVRRGIPAKPALKSWIGYHERILPCREGMLVASFDAVTTDFGAVIRELNARFGTDFEEFRHIEPNVSRVFERIERRNRDRYAPGIEEGARSLARPAANREALKIARQGELEAERLAGLRARANHVYHTLLPQPG